MAKRTYAALPYEYLEEMAELSDAEFGRLCRALIQYSASGIKPELTGPERYCANRVYMQEDRYQVSYDEVSGTRRRAGAAGAAARWEKNREPDDSKAWQSIANDSNGLASDSKNGYTKTNTKTNTETNTNSQPPNGGKDKNARARDFDEFWTAYPKKVGKQSAKKAFEKVNAPLETLLSAIERQKRSSQWSKDGGQYIPNPTTWLNQGRWEDELPGEKPRASPGISAPKTGDLARMQRIYARLNGEGTP